MRSQEFRRSKEAVAKQKAKRIMRKVFGMKDVNERTVGIFASNHCRTCSCSMCGNPRTHLGEVTIQERILDESFTDQILSESGTALQHEKSLVQENDVLNDINDYCLGESSELLISTVTE